jgi:hypothetical protein
MFLGHFLYTGSMVCREVWGHRGDFDEGVGSLDFGSVDGKERREKGNVES